MSLAENLLPLVNRYFSENPAKAALCLEELPEKSAAEILVKLPAATASIIFGRLQVPYMTAVIKQSNPQQLKELFHKLSPEQTASAFLGLSPEQRQQFLDLLPTSMKKQMQEALTFPQDSVGRIMRPDFDSFRPKVKVNEAIKRIRQLVSQKRKIEYLYVVDDDSRLLGVLNMRDLILAPTNETLDNVMHTDVFYVDPFMETEKALTELTKRKYMAAPVVDAQNRILGVLRVKNLMAEIQSGVADDIQKIFGAGGDERSFSPVGFTLRKRLPWLHVNLATAFMAAAVVALFEDIIAKITILAVYLPVVAGQGGNAGAQSLAVVMRGLVMREIPKNQAKNLILKETWVGTLNGFIIGIVTALIAWFWQGNPYLGVVIGLGMLVNLAIAGFAGAAIPLAMKAIGLDPAQCSSIILTTITDVMGFFAFLGFAVIFQAQLI